MEVVFDAPREALKAKRSPRVHTVIAEVCSFGGALRSHVEAVMPTIEPGVIPHTSLMIICGPKATHGHDLNLLDVCPV